MEPVLPNSLPFKVFSIFLSLKVSRCKLFVLTSVNLTFLLIEVILQFTLRKIVFAFVGKPVLMVLDCVAITSQLVSHAILILEALLKRKTDFEIWNAIVDVNKAAGKSSSAFERVFNRDFLLMTLTPTVTRLAVMLATYRTQPNWALAYLTRMASSLINDWAVLVFIYYLRLISDRFALMAQEVDSLCELTQVYKDASFTTVVERIQQLKLTFSKICGLHGLVKSRYEIFLVSFVFLNLCRITSSMYFLGTRLITRRLSYTLESVLCLVPLVYSLIHLSVVAEDFKLKRRRLFEALQELSERNWCNPQVVPVIKSFEIQLMLAKLSPTVGEHLSIEYSTLILNAISVSTTYIFIFLFFN